MSKKKKTSKKNLTADKRAAKKAAVLGTDKKSRLPLISILAVSAILIAAGAFYISRKAPEATSVANVVSPEVSPDVQTNSVAFPVTRFDDGQAQFFSYVDGDEITIKYFVLKSSDGVIRAAFDACDVCWRAGKGYYQNGDVMVCRNCGRTFASILVNEVKGGCNPAPLTRNVADGRVVIQIEDILEGKQYFDFSQAVG